MLCQANALSPSISVALSVNRQVFLPDVDVVKPSYHMAKLSATDVLDAVNTGEKGRAIKIVAERARNRI